MKIRPATKNDLEVIIQFTKELAAYERHGDIEVDKEFFLENFFGANPRLECFLIEDDGGQVIGMGEVFVTLSTHTSSYVLNLHDFYICEASRGKGYGKGFMRFLAQEAKRRECSRVAWGVCDWNKQAINLYDKVGGSVYEGIICYSLLEKEIDLLSEC